MRKRDAGQARRRRWRARLRPRAGRRLPRELAPDSVGALAGALRDGVRDPGFETLLSRIDASPFHAGNRVDVFFRGAEALAAMLAAVDGAAMEVLIESYIWKDDRTGLAFQQALIRAASRGGRVRVLADALGSFRTGRAFWQTLRSHGIEARLYRPLGTPLQKLELRDHRKILVVDRAVAFTGGMNIGDEYGSSLLPPSDVFRDTHARVEGAAAWEMAVVFREGWEQAGGERFALSPLEPANPPGVRVLVLDSRAGRGAEEAAPALAAIVGAARRRLWITMAYFAPRSRAIGVLGAAARRGVDVRLLLPGRTDVPIVRHAGHGFVRDLLQRGVRVFEYLPAILHAKTLVADGTVSVVGSSNLDFRSFERNAECNFLVHDEGVARRMEEQFEADLEGSRELLLPDWDHRSMLHRAGDALARKLAPLL
jgi:cardiolipin synthase